MTSKNNNANKHKLSSIKELRKICQNPYMDPEGPLSEAFSRKTYYKISIYFTWLLLHTNITPNQVTLLSLLVGVAGCIMLSIPGYYPILGVFLLQIWFILDIVDGEIARYRNTCSLTGAFFDRLNTAIIEAGMISSLSYKVYLTFNDARCFIFGFFALISILLLKIIFSYLHVAALEPILHRKHAEMFKKYKEINLWKIRLLHDYLSSKPSSNFIRIAELLIGHGLYISMYIAVAIDSVLNYSFSVLFFKLNLSYLYLLSVGVILPFALIFLITYLIRNNAPEGMYFEILKNFRARRTDALDYNRQGEDGTKARLPSS